jgi:ABC-type transport system involved in cytochrome bd biosynthesis fused ATPase/permease subunit
MTVLRKAFQSIDILDVHVYGGTVFCALGAGIRLGAWAGLLAAGVGLISIAAIQTRG